MTRLFLSLYAFITITLVVLSAVLGYIFLDEPQNDPNQQQLIKTLTWLYKEHALDPQQLKKIGLNARYLNTSDLPWTPQDKAIFNQQKAVILFSNNDNALMYLAANNKILLEISLPTAKHQEPSLFWYTVLFFMLLAIGVAIWLWPLWRDLTTLKVAAKQTDVSLNYKESALPKTSLVYPIGQSLDELNRKVRELINTQMELTGAVAHEFRTPLARLKFSLEAIQSDNIDSVNAIREDIAELEKLMHEMLSYTSLENQNPELSISQIPLLSLCQQRVDLVKHGAHHDALGNICINVNGQNKIVLADEHYIERAIDNLLQNAIRHAKNKISVCVYEKNGRVILEVADNGNGIDISHQHKVFEPFYRPDASRNRARGGAGLGLAIVKRIAKWHQAECWYQQSSLGGAAFCLGFLSSSQVADESPNFLTD